MAKEKGFFVSADLMFALPGQSFNVVMADIEKMVALGVPQVCCYPLNPYPKTKLGREIKNSTVKLPPIRLEKKMYYSIIDFFSDNGYRVGIWEFKKRGVKMEYATCTRSDDYIGLGASAHSMVSSLFYTNIFKLKDYSKSIAQKELPILWGMELAHVMKGGRGLMMRLARSWAADPDIMTDGRKLMMKLARDGSIKKSEFAGFRGAFANMYRMARAFGILKGKSDEIVITRRGNYIFSVMAKEFMPGPGKDSTIWYTS
jgi:coproporphyrinogen III oxidase-like Fe-S oxidoreductase